MKRFLPDLKSRLLYLIVLGSSITCLTACALPTLTSPADGTNETIAAPNQPTSTSTSAPPTLTSTLLPTNTPHPTETSTPLVSPTPTPLLPTPALPLSDVNGFPFSKFFFDNSDNPGCNLPCWKGLTIGTTGPDQVQNMFDTNFGFHGMLDFRTSSPIGRDEQELDGLTEEYIMGYRWFIRPTGLFQVAATFNQNTDHLEGLTFGWMVEQVPSFQVDMTPQHFLQHLGTPSQMLVSANISESATVGGLDLIMVYDQGIVFKWVSSIPMTAEVGSLMGKFCLGKSKVEAGTGLLGRIYIIGPLPNNPSDQSAFQQAVQIDVINRTIKNRGLVPFEDVFEITPTEAAKLALAGGDNCLVTKNLYGGP